MSESNLDTTDEGNGDASEKEPDQRRPVRRANSSKTPFDYPLVSPIFLLVLAAWFGYDGWFNPSTKSIMFNRVVFGFLLVGAMWTLSVDLKIMRLEREKKAAAEAGDATDGADADEHRP